MYIEPQTNIRLLKNVPLDNTYDHTIYFENATDQYNYFRGLQKYNLGSQSYQRVKRGFARVGIKADNLYDCNYMMFQNTAYGNKWFYAFITSVEYLNDVTAEVTFEIDDMQTWFFEHNLQECYVEREHSETDVIGEHIEPEGLALGEYTLNSLETYGALNELVVVILINDSSNVGGKKFDNVVSGCVMYAYKANNYSAIKALLDSQAQSPDAIVAMYMCPMMCFGATFQEGGILQATGETLELSFVATYAGQEIDTYIPTNNKLYTYPYNFFYIDNNNGSSLKLRYEYFKELKPRIDVDMTITYPVKLIARPKQYKGSGNMTYPAESLALENYPMASWNIDAFKAWVAQNSIPIANNLAYSGLQAMSGNAMTASAGKRSLVHQVKETITEAEMASISAPINVGSQANGNPNIAHDKQSFYYGRMSITEQYARMIDDYFTMYGYKTNRCKIPNRNVRPHFTYVKTLGCVLTGSMPADTARHLVEIYDSGITFWKNGNEVGQYSLNNKPTTQE